ncbi:MAG: class I SAM-dependent methyltransferase [Rhodobacteraceae bacterium]|jgi:predicted O-methyltransferase YrrM|nr:class I SAM-dependent methyltransferase [Paracoccaceae bacterium]MBL4556953.1 class I SAM-dependent methyltransferase [Paracoccaceae bacterium]HBG99053.1 class I SAM-dependent methyltransferase [Paracoccaceae bacterium]
MLERINSPGYESLSKPSQEALEVLRRKKAESTALTAAEIGVGIGATTVEMLKVMDGVGELHLFDYEDRVADLIRDIETRGISKGVKLIPHGNGRQTFNSYAWELATMAFSLKSKGLPLEMFDFVYLDGAHSFHHDAPACVTLKDMVRPGGYIVFDDMYWTFNKSPVMNPQKKPSITKDYSDDQLDRPHVELVVEVFMAPDARFEQVFLTGNQKPYRPVFRRVG